MREINSTLQSFKIESASSPNGAFAGYGGGYDRGLNYDHDPRHEQPTRDPDVWPPPTPVEQRLKITLWLIAFSCFLKNEMIIDYFMVKILNLMYNICISCHFRNIQFMIQVITFLF